jgi:hypothetical protein
MIVPRQAPLRLFSRLSAIFFTISGFGPSDAEGGSPVRVKNAVADAVKDAVK